jgi:hypothetical protein
MQAFVDTGQSQALEPDVARRMRPIGKTGESSVIAARKRHAIGRKHRHRAASTADNSQPDAQTRLAELRACRPVTAP